ncbi:hypothetical protein B0H10DRAFT_269192 [Mycena sp. CBHHK59/15]|nr:hypothetical protein B0H10DRAFT_269192 [Mycena sp. CBHHK59/15]
MRLPAALCFTAALMAANTLAVTVHARGGSLIQMFWFWHSCMQDLRSARTSLKPAFGNMLKKPTAKVLTPPVAVPTHTTEPIITTVTNAPGPGASTARAIVPFNPIVTTVRVESSDARDLLIAHQWQCWCGPCNPATSGTFRRVGVRTDRCPTCSVSH